MTFFTNSQEFSPARSPLSTTKQAVASARHLQPCRFTIRPMGHILELEHRPVDPAARRHRAGSQPSLRNRTFMPDRDPPEAADLASPDRVPPINWQALERATHVDPARRGLAHLAAGGRPWDAGNLAAAAQSLAQHGRRVVMVTGFCRRSPLGMTAETDGPPGTVGRPGFGDARNQSASGHRSLRPAAARSRLRPFWPESVHDS